MQWPLLFNSSNKDLFKLTAVGVEGGPVAWIHNQPLIYALTKQNKTGNLSSKELLSEIGNTSFRYIKQHTNDTGNIILRTLLLLQVSESQFGATWYLHALAVIF